MESHPTTRTLRVGMAGLGMIFDETYWPLFQQLLAEGLYQRVTGPVEVELASVLSRTGRKASRLQPSRGFTDADAFLASGLNAVCVATPDDRHFDLARSALRAGLHVLIEKPSVLSLTELDELTDLADCHGVLAKVVYHKLLDPDHKKLRTHVVDGVLRHVNNGYCSLLEPKGISGGQFAEWIVGRNPATYVAVHYLKLIDFTFAPPDDPTAWRLVRLSATGQRGLVGPSAGSTWDSVQTQVVYRHPDKREAAFDIHTSWVTPDDFPGYVEQEVQFRFDNGVWNAHQRKRGVEINVEGRTPHDMKETPNHHYNGRFLEPWGERSQRGYGLEAPRRFFEEVAFVEFGGSAERRPDRVREVTALRYDDLRAERAVIAAVQGLEAILARHAAGKPSCVVEVDPEGADGLWLREPGGGSECLYSQRVYS